MTELTGMTKSSFCASSLIGNCKPYRSSFSRTTTGFGSRIAAFSKPFASSDEYGATTFRPGIEPYHAL